MSTLTIKIEGDGFLSRKQLDKIMEEVCKAQRDGQKICFPAPEASTNAASITQPKSAWRRTVEWLTGR